MSGKLQWLGLAFVEFTTVDGKIVFFDPWTKSKGNPLCPIDVEDIHQADLVLVSRDHGGLRVGKILDTNAYCHLYITRARRQYLKEGHYEDCRVD